MVSSFYTYYTRKVNDRVCLPTESKYLNAYYTRELNFIVFIIR